VRRTLAILLAAEMTGRRLPLTSTDRAHARWIKDLLAALQALADRFWGEIRPEVRMLVVDVDDALPLPFQPTYALPGLRVAHPTKLSSAAIAVNLGDRDLGALKSVWVAAQSTPAYQTAIDGQQLIRADRNLFERMRHYRDGLVATRPVPRLGEKLPGFAQRSISHFLEPDVTLLDRDAALAANALQRYNRLVHAVMVAWLSGIEQEPDLPYADPGDEAMAVEATDEGMSVRLTVRRSSGPLWLKLASPFVVDKETCVDGLYLATAINLRGLRTFSVLDISGDRVRDLGDSVGRSPRGAVRGPPSLDTPGHSLTSS
jgi:hypothetical protein